MLSSLSERLFTKVAQLTFIVLLLLLRGVVSTDSSSCLLRKRELAFLSKLNLASKVGVSRLFLTLKKLKNFKLQATI